MLNWMLNCFYTTNNAQNKEKSGDLTGATSKAWFIILTLLLATRHHNISSQCATKKKSSCEGDKQRTN